VGTGGAIGFAVDRTDETAEAKLGRHISAHAEVLEGIGASIAICSPDKRLILQCRSRRCGTWRRLARRRALVPEGLERLRERRRLPEVADFRAFKSERLRMFTSLIEPQHELMHLPDGRTLLLSISPHPFGGLTFVHEDVTDRLALERSCNTLTQARRATLDHLFEGIAVYGSDGWLVHNPAYLAIWALSEDDVAGEPHIGEIVEKTRAFLRRWRRLDSDEAKNRCQLPAMRWRAARSTGKTFDAAGGDGAASRRRCAPDLPRCDRHLARRAGAA
jgi:PAS domain-containing protein